MPLREKLESRHFANPFRSFCLFCDSLFDSIRVLISESWSVFFAVVFFSIVVVAIRPSSTVFDRHRRRRLHGARERKTDKRKSDRNTRTRTEKRTSVQHDKKVSSIPSFVLGLSVLFSLFRKKATLRFFSFTIINAKTTPLTHSHTCIYKQNKEEALNGAHLRVFFVIVNRMCLGFAEHACIKGGCLSRQKTSKKDAQQETNKGSFCVLSLFLWAFFVVVVCYVVHLGLNLKKKKMRL